MAQIADAIGATVPDLGDERIGEAGQGVVERVADVAVADRHAIGRADELDPLAGRDRPVDLGKRFLIGRPAMAHRVGDLPQRRTHRTHAGERVVLADTPGTKRGRPAAAVTDAPLDQPVRRVVECREVIDECIRFELDGVQEVEGVVERHPVMVVP